MKNFALILTCAAVSALFWLKVNPWLEDPFNWSRVSLWLGPLILLVVSISLLALSFLFLPRYYQKLMVLAIHVGFYVLVFGTNRFLAVGVLAAGGLGWWGMVNIQKEKEDRFKFNLPGMLKSGLHRLLTAAFILISLAYFATPAVQAASQKKELPSGLARMVQVVVNNFMEQELGAGNGELAREANREVLKQINTFLKPYFSYVPPILAFSLFLVLQGFSLIFLWLSLTLSSAVFLVLKWCKVVTIKKIMKEAETVVF